MTPSGYAYEVPFDDGNEKLQQILNAMVEQQYSVLPSDSREIARTAVSERHQASRKGQSALAPTAKLATRRSTRIRAAISLEGDDTVFNMPRSTIDADSDEGVHLPKDDNEIFSVTKSNTTEARFNIKLFNWQNPYLQVDMMPDYRPRSATEDDATYVHLNADDHVVPNPVEGKKWIRSSQDWHSWKRDEEVWTFKARFRVFRTDINRYKARSE
ncbi:uncharacterized protein M421DRAFT_90413 [Didymella exigua CBS 183.55]|uniref:Uncharacterized protein n=1 Tax=Didymella exigua CBS 183.55 TaxID=1150837 RepID=A0A6A5RUU5_9PLEO|nr:uncharacterized protein M421DRAFT_90413 [Didymella exigua CBS 183.55]KAF1931349.1 hypothetical protein M421DRAFT_90413 [Didymella exigua CBS 183.55]